MTRFAPLGPQDTDVTQFEIDFSEAIQFGTFTPDDITVELPGGGAISPTSIVAVDSVGDRFVASFSVPLAAEGDYGVRIGTEIEDLAGNSAGGGGWNEIHKSDFEESVSSQWSNSRVIANPATTTLLGNFGNELVNLSLEGLPTHSAVRITWDVLTIDTWDGNVGGVGPDFFGVQINGLGVVWENTFRNFSGSQSFPRAADSRGQWFGQNRSDAPDSLYKQLQLEADTNLANLEIGFYGRNLQSLGDESWAIDNTIVEVLASSGPYFASFSIDKTGARVLSAQPSGEVNGIVDHVDITFSEPLESSSFTAADISLIGPAGAITIGQPQKLSDAVYRIAFPPQQANGQYSLSVGPDVLDFAGNAMDQDDNGVVGEPTDVFQNDFSIALPDLLVQDPVAPSKSTFAFGESIDVDWTVLNDGAHQALGAITDKVWLSTDDQLSEDDVLLASIDLASDGPVAIDETYAGTASIAVPLDGQRTPGTYYLIVDADSGHTIVESNEGNNQRAVAVELINPPLPDLVAQAIATTDLLLSGETVMLNWQIDNVGSENATGPWTERVYISNSADGSDRQLLQSFVYSGSLAPADTPIDRIETMDLPLTSLSGDIFFFVEVDATNNVVETNEDNLFVSAGSYSVPTLLTFALAASTANEGGASVQATLTRNGDVSQPLVVTLAPSEADQLNLPATVTIAAGQYTKRFNIAAANDDAFDGDVQVVVNATAPGYPSSAAILNGHRQRSTNAGAHAACHRTR